MFVVEAVASPQKAGQQGGKEKKKMGDGMGMWEELERVRAGVGGGG